MPKIEKNRKKIENKIKKISKLNVISQLYSNNVKDSKEKIEIYKQGNKELAQIENNIVKD